MGGWLGYLIAASVLVALAQAFAWLGRRHGRSVRGSLGLAAILIGLGEPLDPPNGRLVEAKSGAEKAPDAAGEPKDSASGS